MDNNNFNNKENLGHGIKGEISTTVDNAKNDRNNNNNKAAKDKKNKK